MANTKAPDHLTKRHDEIVSHRGKLERELLKEQEKLRKVRGGDAGHPEQVAKVNALKAEIARVSQDHAEHARAIALVSGGTNYAPSPGP